MYDSKDLNMKHLMLTQKEKELKRLRIMYRITLALGVTLLLFTLILIVGLSFHF